MEATERPWQVTFDKDNRLLEIETLEQEWGEYRHITNRLPSGSLPGEPQDKFGNSLEMLANAQLIVTAVNSHDALIETGHTLAILALQSNRYTTDMDYRDAVDNCLDAIKLAERGE